MYTKFDGTTTDSHAEYVISWATAAIRLEEKLGVKVYEYATPTFKVCEKGVENITRSTEVAIIPAWLAKKILEL